MPQYIRPIISLLAIVALIVHLTKWREIQFTWEALVLLTIGLLPWLSGFMESFKLGKDGIELNFLVKKLDEVEKKADAAIDASIGGVIKGPLVPNDSESTASFTERSRAKKDSDPHKGKWGGSPISNGRELSAQIVKIAGKPRYRRIILTVASTSMSKPLDGKVVFHLHPTFSRPDFDVKVENGIPRTSLVAYGAFTVGAEADDGATKLELDLTKFDDGADDFFKR